MAKKRNGRGLALAILIALLVALAFIMIIESGKKQEAEGAFLGLYAGTESVAVAQVSTDSLGEPADPDSSRWFWYYKGVPFDTTENVELVYESGIRPNYGTGIVTYTHKAGTATNQLGTYSVLKKVYIQGREIWARDVYQVVTAQIGHGYIFASEAAEIADSTWESHANRTLSTDAYSEIADSVLVHTGESGWSAITQADCDTVKLSGVAIGDAMVIVVSSGDLTTPLYWGRTDGNGCYLIYVRDGETYNVRPLYQGAWLDTWCEVTK